MLVNYKREEAETRHAPSWYEKEQITYLTSTQLVFLDEVHIQQVSGPPTTSKFNEHNIRFPRDENGNINVKRGKYGRFCLGVAKIESKEGKITGKRCPVFDYSGKNIGTIDAYQKEIQK